MPTPTPVEGNQSFTKNRKTVISASDIVSAQRSNGQAYLYEVQGNFTPTTTWDSPSGHIYPVLDKDNNQVQLPPNAMINYVVAHSDVALVSTDGSGGLSNSKNSLKYLVSSSRCLWNSSISS